MVVYIMRIHKFISIICIVLIFLTSCDVNRNRRAFKVMTNFADNDTVCLDMDLDDVVTNGIILPSVSQSKDGIAFSFKAKKGEYYKIYYQNESYKFPEDTLLSRENFYGSWEDASIGFKRVETDGIVSDVFRIVGNPRDEKKFYGADVSKNPFSKEAVDNVIMAIRNTPDWYASIVNKAENNGYSIDKQLYLDAIWIINDKKNAGDHNNRWKRNSRVGCYSFMLVVCNENALKNIPEYIQFIGKTDDAGDFVNPYSFFANNSLEGVEVLKSDKVLKTRAVIIPENGIFLNELTMTSDNYFIDTTDKNCGTSDELYDNALFEQFFSYISRQYTLRNIPVIQDVVSDIDPYTRADYDANKTKFDSTQLQYNYPVTSTCPCTTVRFDENDNSIVLINPGNEDIDNLKKESTGIRTRIGFTYGKYRGKIKFPVMLNNENIWNGLTYAFWLIYQDNHSWNNRRSSKSGYIDKGDESSNPVRKPDNFYSEIDIEIVKASKYWPKQYYYQDAEQDKKFEDATLNDDVMFCCTNWDLACKDPEQFMTGINEITYDDCNFEAMRWYENYKALTIKSPVSNDVFKEDYYYYEIEWKPNEIIWRIGPSPDKMKMVGYMNDKNTNIPNNQMLCIVTQEYHYSEWWPPVVFEQGLIPYNKNDIEGKVYEIVVE